MLILHFVMGILSSKSDKSYEDAILLMSKEHYCNSIQCAYFSGLQLANDKVLININSISAFEKELQSKKGSHLTIIRKAGEFLENPKSKGKLIDMMTNLKRWRKKAIYDDIVFNESQAIEAIDKCQTVRRLLKSV